MQVTTTKQTTAELTILRRYTLNHTHSVCYIIRNEETGAEHAAWIHANGTIACDCGDRQWRHQMCKHLQVATANENARRYHAEAAQQRVEERKAAAHAAFAEARRIEAGWKKQPTFCKGEDLSTKGNIQTVATSANMPAWLAVLPSRQAVA